MSFIRNSILTLLGTVGRVLFSMVSQILISRVLGPAGKGLYNFLVQIPTVLTPMSSLGLNYANTYYTAKDHGAGEKAVGSSTIVAAVLGTLMALLVAVAYLFTRHGYMSEVTIGQLLLIMVSIPFALVSLYWLGVLWGLDRIGKYNIALLVQYIVMAVGALVLTAVHLLTVTTGLTIWMLGNVFMALYMLPDMLRISHGKLFRLDRLYLKQATGYSLQSYIYNVMNVINYRLGLFIVTGFLAMGDVGLYSTSVTLAEMVNYVGNSVNTALIPKLASGTDSVTFDQTPKISRITVFITLLIAIGLAVLGYPLILLFFGRAFAGSFVPLSLMLPGIVALAGATVISGDLMARGKPSYTSVSAAVGVVLTVILNFILVPLWGIKGAASASSLVYIVIFAVNFLFYRRESGHTLADILLLNRKDVGDMTRVVANLWRKRRGKA